MRLLYTICVTVLISAFFKSNAIAEDCSKEVEKYLKDVQLLEKGIKPALPGAVISAGELIARRSKLC